MFFLGEATDFSLFYPEFSCIVSHEAGILKPEQGAIDTEISHQEYQQLTKKASPASPIVQDCLWAFFTGGSICLTGEFLRTGYLFVGCPPQEAAAWTSCTLVLISAIATAFGWYHRLAAKAGAGTLVPITGFANAVVSPAIEFKTEGFITGIGAKMFTIAGPVIVYGTAASVIYGFLYWLTTR